MMKIHSIVIKVDTTKVLKLHCLPELNNVFSIQVVPNRALGKNSTSTNTIGIIDHNYL